MRQQLGNKTGLGCVPVISAITHKPWGIYPDDKELANVHVQIFVHDKKYLILPYFYYGLIEYLHSVPSCRTTNGASRVHAVCPPVHMTNVQNNKWQPLCNKGIALCSSYK